MTTSPFTEMADPNATVELHALSAGHFTLPEYQFVSPCEDGARKMVPSLCFLIQHQSLDTNKTTRIVFDLGLRRDVNRYAEPIRKHTESRYPMTTDPDIVKSLKRGGLTPEDIDYVMYSHVHWDHIGEPRDFPKSNFIVGHESLGLLEGTSLALRGGHSFFESDLLDPARAVQLPDPKQQNGDRNEQFKSNSILDRSWKPLGHLKSTVDLFQDGSLYIVDAPGHLPGHINLLARTMDQDGCQKWVYLAGDACHDRRIFRKEKEIGEWDQLREEFISSMGEDSLHEGWESILRLDPTVFKTSLSLASVPRKKVHLATKEQALIGLAVSANATHLYEPGIRTHVKAAIKEGATIHEVLEVIELSSTVGIHACNIGIPVLVEVLKEEGKFGDLITRDFDDKQNELKEQFTQRRGYWHTFWDDFLRLDPEFFEAYLEFSGAPWVKDVGKGDDPPRGALSPKMKELVYCAFDAAATHLYVPGLKLHIKNALGYGATPHQIIEVMEIATLLDTMANTDPNYTDLHKALFEQGLKTRREVVGSAYVDRALANGSTEFSAPGQELVTEWCWGYAWGRPGLERKQRSLLNIGMLMALNRTPELAVHVRGARNNGLTEEEIREAIIHCTVYCGVPAGVEAMKTAEKVLEEMADKGEKPRELGAKKELFK
ncbi:metallo-hydrolase oxidoreductase [Fusarium pseudoanthophilum]|uniref:Metallo-hydrolase oxidoreductase n=1 Tax=Fusarium pseudoanthophilum TaxID=48495 RepID=A0A8H5L535_9HYPO|nr:metallo-hydrolase oxidoreductase [Fusarium pseudoanthophilum]